MSLLLELLVWLLVPMGLLPVATAVVLWPYRKSESAALRERARLALLLAVLGSIVIVLALNRIASLGIEGELLSLALVGVLLLIDIASGLWLVNYWRGQL